MRSDHDSYKRLLKDCAALGLRQRRFHDLRRTFITLAREDGAEPGHSAALHTRRERAGRDGTLYVVRLGEVVRAGADAQT
jgi:integrase